MNAFQDKAALVTGASRGLGRAIALRLGRGGALVAVHYARDADGARRTVETIEKEGGTAFAVRAELGVPQGVSSLFTDVTKRLRERTGEPGLDILVNNAGVKVAGAPEEATAEDFDRLIAVNARAPFLATVHALTTLRDGGRVINISSGLTRLRDPASLVYAMSKGALEQLTRHLAPALGARGITINTVLPGATRTGQPFWDDPDLAAQITAMSPLRRAGEPEDVADVVAFLASEQGRWVTGSAIDASGGALAG
ncbi:SDR family oxidoreductase [Streptomyces sp. DSM 44915]|uniref:SDR family oxidoreductase n=1 Tax=Streptomyces chisholmiae TaxID=3075540 RepID=A0ABU2JN43_9ACTN|nr:SDR family oxidoreductase [Streptomyces sp. DSM 44915]MDT0266124.1 SDR family oxidoreductase [Streptomyces sp. DSM 44915]